jgi:4-diphosphocytidyl-2-C-methyl-D-erythritol kinase
MVAPAPREKQEKGPSGKGIPLDARIGHGGLAMGRIVHQFAPCKINLSLAVTGPRADGFHDLVSLAVPLTFGDRLRLEERPGQSPDEDPELSVQGPFAAGVPTGGDNLVNRAVRAFRQAGGRLPHGLSIRLEKRVPAGAGLGGGSSDAAACLLALNHLAGQHLDRRALAGIAAGLGSDCPLFLGSGPVIMRGRGERLERPADDRLRWLVDWRFLLFAPAFGVGTPWAYGRLRETPGAYASPAAAEAGVAAWMAGPLEPGFRPLNSFEPVVGAKYLAIPVLLEALRERFGIACALSGSGSACFACLPPGMDAQPVADRVRAAWGPEVFLMEAALQQPFDRGSGH